MNDNISTKQLRHFGFLIGIGFPLIFGILIPLFAGHDFATWTIFFGTPLFFIAILKPKILHKPYKFWISIGNILGWLNSHLILGLVFILILQPIALFMKIFGYDPLNIQRGKKKSYRLNNKDRLIDLNRIF